MKEDSPARLSSEALQKALAKVCEKLIYISETDSPVEPFIDSNINEISEEEVARALNRRPSEAKEQVDLNIFFEKLTRERDWHDEAHKKRAKRFADLEKILRANLDDPGVFRFGTIRIDIFAVGRDSSGKLAGVRTMAVET
jgi:hypothetical protein